MVLKTMVQNMNRKESIKDYKVLIYNNSFLSIDELKALNLLYGPLMGSLALQIYLTFSSIEDSLFTHENIFDILNISEKEFIEARTKLEALGLIETYTDSSSYYYFLLHPQKASSFIKSGVLGIYLNSKIGNDNLKKILACFKKTLPDMNGLTNITKSFDEVFEIKNEENYNLKNVDLADSKSKAINLKSSFDIEDVIDRINTSYIKTSLDEFKKYISNIEAVYKISKEEIITTYNQSIVNDTFNKQVFTRKIKLIYERNNNGNNVVFQAKDESENDVVKVFSEVSVSELLEKENLNTLKNMSVVAEIYNEIPYEKTIVNMMIYSVISKLHELPKLGYFEAMYNTMKEHNINTSLEAYDYLFTDVNTKESKKKEYIRKHKIKDNNPDWAKQANNDILKGFNKVEDDD